MALWRSERRWGAVPFSCLLTAKSGLCKCLKLAVNTNVTANVTANVTTNVTTKRYCQR